jgi:hypothetical protein
MTDKNKKSRHSGSPLFVEGFPSELFADRCCLGKANVIPFQD